MKRICFEQRDLTNVSGKSLTAQRYEWRAANYRMGGRGVVHVSTCAGLYAKDLCTLHNFHLNKIIQIKPQC